MATYKQQGVPVSVIFETNTGELFKAKIEAPENCYEIRVIFTIDNAVRIEYDYYAEI